MSRAKAVLVVFGLIVGTSAPASAQMPASPAPAAVEAVRRAKPVTLAIKAKLNAWTVGLAGGLLEGAPIRFATEIARVTDDAENLHVLPIVTRGPAENIEDLLYLKGVDLAIINSDALEEFKTLVPDIRQRVTYVLNLFPSELHIFVRPEINSLADLRGKKVNFNTPGTAAAYSGPLIFDKLKVDAEKTFLPHPAALEQMKTGQIAAAVFVTSKPIELLTRSRWEAGFKFLPVPWEQFEEYYLPSTLSESDYPQLVQPGQKVDTIAVPTVLAAFNWPAASDRYKRVARFTDYLFSRIDQLKQPGFHPKWKDVNISSEVPGLNRFPAARDWLARSSNVNTRAANPPRSRAPLAGGGTRDGTEQNRPQQARP